MTVPETTSPTLSTHIIDAIISAARLGWTPDDLKHIAGPHVLPFLHAARLMATAAAEGQVAAAWQRQLPTPSRRGRRLPSPEKSADILMRLSRLSPATCAAALTDLSALRGHNTSTLSEEQRRAQQRITGLLKKAESTTFEAEAQTLIAKAQQLRQRYRIESVEAETAPGDSVAVRVHLAAPWVRYQFLLLGQVARANSSRALLYPDIGIATVVGHPDDVLHAIELFHSLNRQRAYFMRHSPGAQFARAKRETKAYRRSFLTAYAGRIGDLLTEATEDTVVTEQERTSALPVLARRAVAAEETFTTLFPHTSTMSFQHKYHVGGAVDGMAAAERSHLGSDLTAVGSA
ncbi:MAG: DUF2786 domain-containing protein [Corynebacterium sp.]|uniref:DUF2786 domain-containing protein n=1 Tax=Corynebacterium sp. TaxID=1720 RepID=UPI0026DF1980|nr:DUF2786 domain-containing protein [Corynebacterium sp.]MDO5669135.1 DUF2786 domain-containing protein [Corynebacterium sp.]